MAARLDRVIVLNPSSLPQVGNVGAASPKTLLGAKNSASRLSGNSQNQRNQVGSHKKEVHFMQQIKQVPGQGRKDSISLEDEEYGDLIKDYYRKRGAPVAATKRVTSHPDEQNLEHVRGRVESSYKNNALPRASSQYQSVASSNKDRGLERSDRTLLDRRKIVVKHGLGSVSRPQDPNKSREQGQFPAESRIRQGKPGGYGGSAAKPDFYSPRSPRQSITGKKSDPLLYLLKPGIAGVHLKPQSDAQAGFVLENSGKRMDKNPSFGPQDRGGIQMWNAAHNASSHDNSRVSSSLLGPAFPPIERTSYGNQPRYEDRNRPISDWELEQKLNQHLKIAEQLRERGRMFRESKKYTDELLIESILSDGNKRTIQEHMKEWHGSRMPQSYLDYNKSRAKATTKVGEFNQQIRHIADESKSHEVNEYAKSNLQRFDQEAAQEPVRLKHLQKRNILSGLPPSRLESGRPEPPENKYLESIRAKFGFLEGVVYSGGLAQRRKPG